LPNSKNKPDALLVVTDDWRRDHPGATVACMSMVGVQNPQQHAGLDEALSEVETILRSRYLGYDRDRLRSTGVFPAYDAYYRRFGQNYHVLHQVESVALKGKPIPRRAALVEAAFKSELGNGILTAIHDLDALDLPITVDSGTGSERYVLYNGNEVPVKDGDMYMRDRRGILTSIILGPARYALVQPDTTGVAVCIYGPSGVGADAIESHLHHIAADLRLISPGALMGDLSIVSN
jgi:DNA/RNA-binding domain of Phe-tRNA-synthetase-like protein